MAEQEFLASFGVEIDESGVQRLRVALEQNRELAEELAAAFNRAREAVQAFFADLSKLSLQNWKGSYARGTEQQEGITVPFSLDFTKATQELNAFIKAAGKAFRLNADASGIVSAGQSALSQLQTLFASTVLPLNVQEIVTPADTSGASGTTGSSESSGSSGTSGTASGNTQVNTHALSLTKAATGGRFSVPTKAEIAEDGDPEYVIPVKKESIAVPLLRQVIGELSEPAREMVQGGQERGDALSGLPDLLASANGAAAPVITQNTNQSVQAPVSIQVTAAASDPEAVGRSVYDVAEQYLLRTLKSAMG